MSKVLEESPSQRAREALSRHAWQEAYDLIAVAERTGELSADDLEILAQAAWWTGRPETSHESWERAYAAHVKAGDKVRRQAWSLSQPPWPLSQFVKRGPNDAPHRFRKALRRLRSAEDS